MYKFGSLKQADWQMMYDLAKMFLYCFNHWKLETPSVHAHSSASDNQRIYKENYSRYVLVSCDSVVHWLVLAPYKHISQRLLLSVLTISFIPFYFVSAYVAGNLQGSRGLAVHSTD